MVKSITWLLIFCMSLPAFAQDQNSPNLMAELANDPSVEIRKLADLVADNIIELNNLRSQNTSISDPTLLKHRQNAKNIFERSRELYKDTYSYNHMSVPALAGVAAAFGAGGAFGTIAAISGIFLLDQVHLLPKALEGGPLVLGLLTSIILTGMRSTKTALKIYDFLHENDPNFNKLKHTFYNQLERRGIEVPKKNKDEWLAQLIKGVFAEDYILSSPERISDAAQNIRRRILAEAEKLNHTQEELDKREILLSVARKIPVKGYAWWRPVLSKKSFIKDVYSKINEVREELSELYYKLELNKHHIVLEDIINASPSSIQKDIVEAAAVVQAHDSSDTVSKAFADIARFRILDLTLGKIADSIKPDGKITLQVQDFKFDVLPKQGTPGFVKLNIKVTIKDGDYVKSIDNLIIGFKTWHTSAIEIAEEAGWIRSFNEKLDNVLTQDSTILARLPKLQAACKAQQIETLLEGSANLAEESLPARTRTKAN